MEFIMDAPIEENYDAGFLGSFLSNSLKTNQLEVNTDARTLRPVARLKEPRDLFALPKERDYDCPQQAPRWPTECQVLDERVYHIEYAPEQPEPYYQPTGKELQPRPVGEENGVVVFNYTPISAVHYDNKSSSSSTSSCNNEPVAPEIDFWNQINFSLNNRKMSASSVASSGNDEEGDADDDNDDEASTRESDNDSGLSRSQSPSNLITANKTEECTCDLSNMVGYKFLRCCCKLENTTCTTTTTTTNQKNNKKSNSSCSSSNNKKLKHNFMSGKKTTQFSRSSVGGSKFLLSCHPTLEPSDLIFESRFESGNLAKAVKITPTYYELYLRPDMYTNRHTQWFYFRVKNTKKNVVYRFSIINLTKPDSLYQQGMRPLMYSVTDATNNMIGWRRCGENIAYFRNDDNGYSINSFASKFCGQNGDEEDDEPLGNMSFTLTFNVEFQYDNDTVYFAHSYPYTYSDLQDYLMAIQRHPVKSKFCKLRLLCRSLAGNNVYYLTVTAPTPPEEETTKKKKAIVISSRVHAGESPASWMMKGFMDFITGDSFVAKKLRHKFIFKLIPMLNPDGVIVGNTRSSLTGRDLNRQYRTVIRETYPSIWNTKAMIKRLMEDCGVVMYCDMHAHSRKHNIFIYGCENLKRHPDRRLLEQVFPLMLHKNVADKFSFENCKFKVQKNKEGTGRIVVWVLGVTNSYTLEASFAGSTMGSRNGTHFSTADFEHIGRAYCETLMDYYDDNPVKERLRLKILTRLSKEGSSADEPLNIPLSDYSSDEGDTSSSSTEDEGKDRLSDLEGPCCQPLKVPPSSPVVEEKPRKKKIKKQRAIIKVSSAGKKKNKSVRTTMSVPTTDPGSDFFELSSDEELLSDGENDEGLPRMKKHSKVRATEGYKKVVLYESQTQTANMPPELIITSAKGTDETNPEVALPTVTQSAPAATGTTQPEVKLPQTDKSEKAAFSQNIIKEFPPLSQRTKSWHSFNRCLSTIRIRNTNSDYHTAENLQVKLSLKKQIWTGTHSADTATVDIARPLSWGVSSMLKPNQPYDSMALLTACSQKLAAWQETQTKPTIAPKSPQRVLTTTGKVKESRHQIPKTPILIEKKLTPVIEAMPTPRLKKKTKTIKLVETAEIISHLSSKKSAAGNRLAPVSNNNQNNNQSNNNNSGNSSRSITANNRFRTGGLVAAAVQTKKTPKQVNYQHHHQKSARLSSLVFSESEDNIKVTLRRHKSKTKAKDFGNGKKA